MSNYASSSFLRDKNSSWYKVYSMVKPGSKVLDVGCSSGNFGKVLIDEKQCTVHGIEIDKKDFDAANKQLHKMFRLNVEADKLDELDTDYDFIYFGDVIEHLVTPSATLHRMLPCLKNSGRLLFSVPNMTHILVRLMLLQGKFTYGKTGLLDRTHLHYYDYDFLELTLNEAGFTVEAMDPMLKDIPEEIIAEELAKLGLASTKQFLDFTRTTHASVYQFVGRAKKTPAGTKAKHLPLVLSSPVDIFETYLANTTKYYEGTVANLKKQIDHADKQRQAEIKQLQEQNQALEQHLHAILNSRSWKLVEAARRVTGRKKG